MKTVPDLVSLEEPVGHEAASAPAQGGPRRLLLLSCGHFTIDLYSAALGALQPLILTRHGLSLLQAGILGGLLYFSSSVTQPLYGYLSDRLQVRAFTVLAPLVAGVFISGLGLAPNYAMLLLLVFLGGAGISSFHPQGTAHASSTLRDRRGLAMAIFITSGTTGLSCGPTYFSLLTHWLGFERSYWAAIPGVLMTLVLFAKLPALPRHKHTAGPHFDIEPLRRVWKPMTLLYFLVVIRSVIQIVFAQFLTLYFHLDRGFTVTRSSYVLTLFLLAGAIGGFAGGNLADRFGGKRIVTISMIGSVPFLVIFLMTRGLPSLAALGAGGLILLFTVPVNVTMAQELVPHGQAGTVSALMMGFAWGIAGLIVVPLFGWAADHIGLHNALWGVILLPLAGFLLAMELPEKHRVAT